MIAATSSIRAYQLGSTSTWLLQLGILNLRATIFKVMRDILKYAR